MAPSSAGLPVPAARTFGQRCMRSLYNSIRHLLQRKTILPTSLIVLSTPPLSKKNLFQTQFTRSIMGSSSSSTIDYPVQKSDEEWRAVLSPEQFRVLRQKGTEMAGTGKYEHFKGEGIFNCGACGAPLYKSSSKFNSGCGWPAFAEAYDSFVLYGLTTVSPVQLNDSKTSHGE